MLLASEVRFWSPTTTEVTVIICTNQPKIWEVVLRVEGDVVAGDVLVSFLRRGVGEVGVVGDAFFRRAGLQQHE